MVSIQVAAGTVEPHGDHTLLLGACENLGKQGGHIVPWHGTRSTRQVETIACEDSSFGLRGSGIRAS